MVGGATTLGSRFTLQLAISSYLGSKVVSGAMMGAAAKLFTRLGTGAMFGGVVLQGLISRACSASRRLQMSNPKLWQLLAINDYDMLYFLFEEPLKPITELSETLRKNPAKSEQLLREIENL
ncbi:hypothetical protein [Serratia rhizosphaerae]|uniref:hypothetical protein n=1 Tax=Serratia rhizosphaerae TaxID=2597702 RepID=UPI001FE8739E|nr:hypothetical protein [Serratia rhizosphaerae]MEB6335361.1 hypothetical protein [Serratia rhizosphaerae]